MTKFRFFFLLILWVLVLDFAACGESTTSKHQQELAKLERLLTQDSNSQARNLADELLARYDGDVVLLSDLRKLAAKHGAGGLEHEAELKLSKLVKQYKRLEVFISLVNLSSSSSLQLFLGRNNARLDKATEKFLSALSKYRKNDFATAFSELTNIAQIEQLDPKLKYLVLWYSMLSKIGLGQNDIAQELREKLNIFSDTTGIYSSVSSERFQYIKNWVPKKDDLHPYFDEYQADLDSELTQWVAPQKNMLDSEVPQICRGRNVFDGTVFWGATSVCEDGAAMIGNSKPGVGYFTPSADIPVVGYCCQLPTTSIFSDEVTYEEHQCPKNSIVTAAIPRCGFSNRLYKGLISGKHRCSTALECRKLNTEKYELLPPEKGIHFGDGFTAWLQGLSVSKHSLPKEIHSVLGRISKFFWELDGCTAKSLGGFLVAKKGRRCYDHYFSRIVAKEKTLKAKTRREISIFPECPTYLDPYSLDRHCNS